MSQSMADLFKSITTGVHVIGVADGEIRNAFTAAWVMQVSFRPLMIALSISPSHKSHGLLVAGRHFSVNVLDQRQMIRVIPIQQRVMVFRMRFIEGLAGIGQRLVQEGHPLPRRLRRHEIPPEGIG